MSEELEDICYVKFVSTEIVTPVANDATQGLWATYEVVNIGTAPTDHEHSVAVGPCFSNTSIGDGRDHRLDDPILEANGGSYKGTVHFPMDELPWEGDWELSFMVCVGVNKGISDSASLPFKVEHLTPS
jgi:hypothetical protein